MGFGDDSGISWTICKQFAPRSRQIATPTPHHSIFTHQMLFLTPKWHWRHVLLRLLHYGMLYYKSTTRHICLNALINVCHLSEISRVQLKGFRINGHRQLVWQYILQANCQYLQPKPTVQNKEMPIRHKDSKCNPVCIWRTLIYNNYY